MVESLIAIYHAVNVFLSTPSGSLLKQSAELMLITFATYMIVSEWLRERYNIQLKYLIIAFATLAIDKLIVVLLLSHEVFLGLSPVYQYVAVLDNSLELLGLALIANAFLYPVFSHNLSQFKSKVTTECGIIAVIFIFFQSVWIFKQIVLPFPLFEQQPEFLLFNILKIILLMYPLYFLAMETERFGSVRNALIGAFVIYSITPLVHIINYLAFTSISLKLRVLAHPFPFIAVVLFTRIVYLKLAEKANLKKELVATRRKYKETKELSEMKDDFISTVSHELRTPLTSMNLYLGLMQNEASGKLTKEQKKYVGIVKTENSRLGELINDLLDLSKLEGKRVELKKEPVLLKKLVEETIHTNLASEKGITVQVKIPKTLRVTIDPNRFAQIIINLFSNAVKFTDKKGKIVISARKEASFWEFKVTDTGRGIPKDELGKLFDKFYQIEHHMTRSQGGTGLGLAIVKHLVSLHDGSIEVRSKVGKGSSFGLKFPSR